MSPPSAKQRFHFGLVALITATQLVPGFAFAQATPPNNGAPNAQADGRGLVVQPAAPAPPPGSGSTSYGGLVTTPGSNPPAGGTDAATPMGGLVPTAPSTPAQPAMTPMQALQAVVNTPNVTTGQICSAVSVYWSAIGDNPRVPLTPTGDASYTSAYNAMQAQMNQTIGPTQFEAVVQATGIVYQMSPGPQRDAAVEAVNQLDALELQRDANYVLYQDVAVATQLNADGHPGAAVAILIDDWAPYGFDPANYNLAQLKADYEASQFELDAAWGGLQTTYGISRADLLANINAANANAGESSPQSSDAYLPSALTAGEPDSPMPSIFVAAELMANGEPIDLSQLEDISANSDPPMPGGVGAADVAPTNANDGTGQPGSPGNPAPLSSPPSLCGR